jgi:spore germination protein YaaH
MILSKRLLGCLLAVVLLLQWVAPAAVHAADQTTKYRLYEENKVIKEYTSLDKAIADGKKLRNSHVELISNRNWAWDNLPKYRVYQYETSLPEWQFATLPEAEKIAKQFANSSIRDLNGDGWVWSNYAAGKTQYKLHQGEVSLPEWTFNDLESAQKEAKKWANVHIINLSTNQWEWDNIKPERKEELRAGDILYQIYIGEVAQENLRYAYLEDAISKSLEIDNSTIINLKTRKFVYSNIRPYEVLQNNKVIQGFTNLNDAIAYAKKWAHATIKWKNREIWSNYPFYQVYQHDLLIKEFKNVKDAVAYATGYSNASVVTLENEILWDNKRLLQFWSWNGSSNPDTIRTHVTGTMGLDVVSPTWFELQSADGTLKDASDKATANWLKEQKYAVHPLVHNQFDSSLTSAFLKDTKAQTKFITALVNKSADLGVTGINLDFESLSGKDRDAYTNFVRNLTAAAHAKNLTVSIDLPRGSVKWNHLTAFDHEKLAGIVDYIITMTYDQYYSGSPDPGSVAGLQWTEEGIVEFLSYGIPRDKLIMGIPFYVRDWKLDSQGKLAGNRALLMRNIPDLLATKQTTMVWDEQFKQYKVTYQEDGYTRVFWLEDEKTVEERLKLAKKYDIAGVAAWRMGHEYASIWETMLKNK